MATYQEGSNQVSPGAVSGFGGVAGAIPFVNVFSNAITSGIANGAEADIRAATLRNVENLGTPVLGGRYSGYGYGGDLAPEMFGSPEAAQAQQAQMDPQTLAARRAAIEQLSSMGTGAASAQEEANRRSALFDSAQQAGAQSAGLREEMAARGKGGAGAEWAMRQRAGQAGANMAMQGGLQATAQGSAQRLAAMQAYENSLGGLSDDQQQLNTHNSDLVSQFNMANSNLRNQVNMANTSMRNGAQQRNMDSKQNLSNMNVNNKNNNVDLANRLSQKNWDNQAAQTEAVNNILMGQAAQFRQSGLDAERTGKEGSDNLKSAMSMGAGGAGGAMGGMGGGGGEAAGGGGMDFSKYMSMFGGK